MCLNDPLSSPDLRDGRALPAILRDAGLPRLARTVAADAPTCPGCGSRNVTLRPERVKAEPPGNGPDGVAYYADCNDPNCGDSNELEHLFRTDAELAQERERLEADAAGL